MGTGYYFCIGVNEPSSERYGATPERLLGSHNDATAMQALAESLKFKPLDKDSPLLIGSEARLESVQPILAQAPGRVGSKDLLLLTFSGHGNVRFKAKTPGLQEDRTETWCLHNSELFDLELGELWTRFDPGARILVISDSCHSGSVSHAPAGFASRRDGRVTNNPEIGTSVATYRSYSRRGGRALKSLDPTASQTALDLAGEDYKSRLEKVMRRAEAKARTKAWVLLLAACDQDGDALDSQRASFPLALFTEALLDSWMQGDFQGDYSSFIGEIARRVQFLESGQKPRHLEHGAGSFLKQRPFTS